MQVAEEVAKLALFKTRGARTAHLRRRILRPAVARPARRRADHHRHAGSRHGSPRPRHALAQGSDDGRARRGRPDARHGFPRGHRENSFPGPGRAADGALFGHGATADPGHHPPLHAGRRPRPHRVAGADGAGHRAGLLRGGPPLEARSALPAPRPGGREAGHHLLRDQDHGGRIDRAISPHAVTGRKRCTAI